jgi:hypothetical protein
MRHRNQAPSWSPRICHRLKTLKMMSPDCASASLNFIAYERPEHSSKSPQQLKNLSCVNSDQSKTSYSNLRTEKGCWTCPCPRYSLEDTRRPLGAASDSFNRALLCLPTRAAIRQWLRSVIDN